MGGLHCEGGAWIVGEEQRRSRRRLAQVQPVFGDIHTLSSKKSFAIVQTVYERHKLACLRFEGYRSKWTRRSACFDRATTVSLQDKFIACLRRHGNLDVRVVNEAYTTKHCSNYKSNTGVDSTLSVSKSLHRYVHYQVCRKGCNRGRNGVKNILLKQCLFIKILLIASNVGCPFLWHYLRYFLLPPVHHILEFCLCFH